MRKLTAGTAAAPAADPLGGLQWDMALIRATLAGSYGVEQGDRGVRVGVLDTGIDGTHADIAPNFDAALSRTSPSTSASTAPAPPRRTAPATTRRTWTRTATARIAGTIGSPLDGFGMAGVARTSRS